MINSKGISGGLVRDADDAVMLVGSARRGPRVGRPHRRWALVMIVLAALGSGVDAGARWYAQNSVESRLRVALGVESMPEVSFDGWPFLAHAARGSMRSLTISADQVDLDPLVATGFTVELEGVTFSPAGLAADPEGSTVRARSGRGVVEIGADEFTQAARDHGYKAKVSFSGDRVNIESKGRLYTDEVDFRVQGRRLVAYPSRMAEPISVRLPKLGKGVYYEGVEVRDSVALVTLRFHNATLPLDLELANGTYRVCRQGKTSASIRRSC